MNAKISRNSRGKTRAMEFHLYNMDFFFSLTRIFLGTFRNIAYNFLLCCVRISRIMNVKKNSKFEREDKVNGIPLLIVFLSQEFSYEHSEGRQGTVQHVLYGMRKRPSHGKSVLYLW